MSLKSDGSTKKNDILESVMNRLGDTPTEVTEPPREYNELGQQHRNDDSGAAKIINLPGMVNVFGPPPKSFLQQQSHEPLHLLELPNAAKNRAVHSKFEVVPPQFDSERVPVHFFPHVRPTEITGGTPRHLFLPYPKHFGLHPPHLGGFHQGFDEGLHGGFHGGFHDGFNEGTHGPLLHNGFDGGFHDALGGGFNRLHDGFDGEFNHLHAGSHGEFNQLHGGFHGGFHADENGFDLTGLSPLSHESIHTEGFPYEHNSEHPDFTPYSHDDGPAVADSDIPHYSRFDSPYPDSQHIDLRGHEMGNYFKIPAPQITRHLPKHIYLPGKEVTVGDEKEYNLNNEVHVVNHAHHHHHHNHDEHEDHDEHIEDHDIPQGVQPYEDTDAPYVAHETPITIGEPDHVVHEHHEIEHHHHLGEKASTI